MKRATTLLIALFASIAFINAQNCDFTYTAGNNPGEFIFMGPQDYANQQEAYTFYWGFDAGAAFTTGFNVNHTFTQSGFTLVTLMVVNNTPDSTIACQSMDTLSIVLDDSLDCNYQITYSASPANPNMISFNIPNVQGGNILWDFGDFTEDFGLGETIHEYANAGEYIVCATIPNNLGNECYICTPVVVNGDSIIITPDCNADFWSSTSALTGYFVPAINDYYGDYDYSWDFGDGATSTEMYPYHNYNEEGSYEVCLTITDADGLCSDTYCETVYIPGENVFPPDSTCFADFVITQDDMFEVIVVNGASGNQLDFTWTLEGEGISITSSGAFPTIEVETTGAFLFCLTVSDGANCSATYCDSLVVDDNGIIGGKVSAAGFTINVVSPMQITDFPTSIETAEQTDFTVYPNPFETNLVIQTDSNDDFNYEIYSVDGRLIKNGMIQGDNQTINTSELKSGIYLLNLNNNNGVRSIQKIVKK